ncbi:MAG: hypothetical protein U0599_15170 [Vicinamibacteria bacterium]
MARGSSPSAGRSTARPTSALADGGGPQAEAAVREARAIGIAGPTPTLDLDGWDAAVKGCALANALLRRPSRPAEVRRQGIAARPRRPGRARRAVREGFRLRLVVRGVAPAVAWPFRSGRSGSRSATRFRDPGRTPPSCSRPT